MANRLEKKLHRQRPQIALTRASFKSISKIAKKEGRQGGEARRQRQPRPAQNGGYEGRRMTGDKAAAAAKSKPDKLGDLGDKAASRPFRDFGISNPAIGSKNPYSFQLSGE